MQIRCLLGSRTKYKGECGVWSQGDDDNPERGSIVTYSQRPAVCGSDPVWG